MHIPQHKQMLLLSSVFTGAGVSLVIAAVIAAQTVVVPLPTYLGSITHIPTPITADVICRHWGYTQCGGTCPEGTMEEGSPSSMACWTRTNPDGENQAAACIKCVPKEGKSASIAPLHNGSPKHMASKAKNGAQAK